MLDVEPELFPPELVPELLDPEEEPPPEAPPAPEEARPPLEASSRTVPEEAPLDDCAAPLSVPTAWLPPPPPHATKQATLTTRIVPHG